MTDEERKALVERLRWAREWYFVDAYDGKAYASDDPLDAAVYIEADGQRITELEAALRDIDRLTDDFESTSAMTAHERVIFKIARAALGETK